MSKKSLRDLPIANLLPWQRIAQFLFGPHATLTEVTARRQARLLSVIALLFTLKTIIELLAIMFVAKSGRITLNLLVLTAVSMLGYALSRTHLNKVGGYAIVWALVLSAFLGNSSTSLSYSIYSNLIPALIIASILFPFRYMLFFVVLNNLILVAMEVLPLGHTSVGTDFSVFLLFSVLILAITYYHEKVEHERFTELKLINQELSTLNMELKGQIESRTDKLRERSRKMQAMTEVARTAASFQDIDRLLTSSARLISESFGYYHVGIFLLDEDGQYATLRATNSQGGQRMLSRMYTLPIDFNSIVGYAAKTQVPRHALDTGTDSAYFNNPDLPETRSEIAIPLKVGMRLIGILDVQSTEKDAFSEDDVNILSTLGDQLAVALDNTRLLTEARRALATSEQTNQRYFNQAWSQFAHRLNQEGYRYSDEKVIPLRENAGENPTQAKDKQPSKLSIPLIIRGQNIGAIDVKPVDEKRSWTQDDIALLEVVADRVGLALESARLLEDAQRRAARERTISAISAQIGSAVQMEDVLRFAVEELGRKMGGAEVIVELGVQ